MLLKRSGKALAVFTLLLVAGCKNSGTLFPAVSDTIKIQSEPSGAEVYVMGEKIGVTPLNINPKDVFPNTYQKEKEPLYGKVTLKKTGCSDFTRSVSSEISNVGLKAQLECTDMNAALAKTSKDAPRINETVEQRLDKIKNLLDKGLITEEEAKNARARILNDL
jgi:hypothetical protein